MTKIYQMYKVTATDGRRTISAKVIGLTKEVRLKRCLRDNKIKSEEQKKRFSIVSEERLKLLSDL